MSNTEKTIINAIKVGNTVNISINGKLHKKACSSHKESEELFRLVQQAKENPTPENIRLIKGALNEKTRIAMKCGLEADMENGEVYIAGFSTPIPETLSKFIEDYYDNGYPIEAIVNFWKLLMINPDKRVRVSLFDFITAHDFVITDTGYFIAYKAVKYAVNEKKDNDLAEFVSNQVLHVRKNWKTSPNRYTVYKDLATSELHITKSTVSDGWNEKERNIQIIGNLGELMKNVDLLPEDTKSIYTDKHTGKMQIQLGFPVMQKRGKCDSNPGKECSHGLHVGATSYVNNFGSNGDVILVCLVNPANVVSVPDYDKTKIRVCEYFPFAMATFVDKKIDIIDQPYFESDYKTYEEKSLNEMIAKVKANEIPIEKAMNCDADEVRPMAELMKIIENRIVVLGN